MSQPRLPLPPRVPALTLRWLLPRRLRSVVMDDMREEYRLFCRELGKAAADRWYRVHVARSLGTALQLRLPLPDWLSAMEVNWNELRQAARRLASTPAFTVATTVTLALGIGATTAIFSLVNSVLLRPLPYPESSRLVSVHHSAPGLGLDKLGQSWGTYVLYREQAETLDAIGLYQEAVVNLTGDGQPERISLAMVNDSFFATMATLPVLGRVFAAEDMAPGRETVVLLSHELWTARYGADAEIIGRSIVVNGAAREVVGVMPASFRFPSPATRMWMSLTEDPAEIRGGGMYFEAVARRARGVPVEAVAAEMQTLIPELPELYDDITPDLMQRAQFAAVVQPLKVTIVGDVGTALYTLLATVALVLTIACANVTNLFLVRAEHRGREVAVRRALGAGRGALARFFASESVLLGLLGGLGGLLLARAIVRAFVVLDPGNIPRLEEVRVDVWTLLLAAVVTLIAVVLFALAPIVRHRGVDPAAMLRGGRGATAGSARARGRQVLVAVQVGLALVLLVGSGLVATSYWHLSRVDPGFEPTGVLTAQISLPFRDYGGYEASARFFDELLEQVRAMPGVNAAGAVSHLPLAPFPFADVPFVVEAEWRPPTPGEMPPMVKLKMMTPGYFEAMAIDVIEGAAPLRDASADERPVLLSAPLAARLFPDSGAVGQRVRRAKGDDELPWATVVGVVGPVHDDSIRGTAAEIYYLPVLERLADPGFSPGFMTLVIRSAGDPTLLVPAVRQVIATIDSGLPLSAVGTMESIVADSTAQTSFTMLVLLVAAGASLLLGAIGLYAVVAYVVSQRTREIGVRIALGAESLDVARWVVGQGTRPVVIGLVGGLLAALGLTRFLRALLYEVAPTDPWIFASTIALLAAVAFVATWLPARRASRIDPVRALSSD